MPNIPKMRKGNWIVFANGVGVYTYSQVTRTPHPPHSERARIATVDTIDGFCFQKLVTDVCSTRQLAKELCDKHNMEGATT